MKIWFQINITAWSWNGARWAIFSYTHNVLPLVGITGQFLRPVASDRARDKRLRDQKYICIEKLSNALEGHIFFKVFITAIEVRTQNVPLNLQAFGKKCNNYFLFLSNLKTSLTFGRVSVYLLENKHCHIGQDLHLSSSVLVAKFLPDQHCTC